MITDPSERPAVSIRFDGPGSNRFRALTSGHIGRSLGVVVDDVMVSAPTVLMAISTQAMLTGNFTQQRAIDLAYGLRRGMSRRVVLSWGPVKEMTLNDIDESETANLLDLDRGLLWDNPAGSDAQQALAFIKQHDVDLLFDHSSQGWALITPEAQALAFALEGSGAWDTIPPGFLPTFVAQNPLASVQRGEEASDWRTYPLPMSSDGPATLAFLTGSGRYGLLQVTERLNSPARLKLRFKLVAESHQWKF
jgi:hypothetical protein